MRREQIGGFPIVLHLDFHPGQSHDRSHTHGHLSWIDLGIHELNVLAVDGDRFDIGIGDSDV